jgi:hypothetical protein
MKLDPSDNRVAKYCQYDTKAEADDHVAAHIGDYPDAFVYEDADNAPVIDAGTWRFDPSTKEVLDRIKRPKPERDMARLRTKRNSLLASSDWTQSADSPLDKEAKTEWSSFRQLLRDLPASTEDPANPSWPDAPS